jgi:formylglycine-generating enzyme required for sulfatase activity
MNQTLDPFTINWKACGIALPGVAIMLFFTGLQTELTGREHPTVASSGENDSMPGSPGIRTTRPESGRFVEVDGKFMVPYTSRIPGTNVDFEMVPIPGGTFKMGSPESEADRNEDEGPVIDVVVRPFWMGRYEVTWAEYEQYMALDEAFKKLHREGLRKITEENEIDGVTAPSELYDPDFTHDAGVGPEQPAATMTQYAAKQYTKWLSLIDGRFYRLPTEAEWEHACRAGTKTAWYFGDDADQLDEHAWHLDNGDDERHNVGKLKPNPWGLYDMYGNVAEWVLDAYSEDGYFHQAELELSKAETLTAAEAWRRPKKLYPRVVRGGSFELEPSYCRSAARFASHDKDWSIEDPNFPKSPWWFTDSPGLGIGFRIIRPLNPPERRAEKESFWNADIAKIKRDAKNRIESNGRGSWGAVDPDLPRDIAGVEE